MMLTGFLYIQLGLILLSLISKRHRDDVFPRLSTLSAWQIRTLKLIGYLCLFTSLMIYQKSAGLTLGLVYLSAWITLAALMQSLLLSYCPRWNRVLIPLLVIAVPASTYFNWA